MKRYDKYDIEPLMECMNKPDHFVIRSIVEIPKGSQNKYEIDKETGLMKLDRHLYSSSHYPGDYGFIPRTLAEDGDALDVLVMVNDPTFSGCLIHARVIGVFKMQDRDANDYKILAIPESDPLFSGYEQLSDAPVHFRREVEHFFLTYKQLEGATVTSQGWADRAEAIEEIRACIDRYEELVK